MKKYIKDIRDRIAKDAAYFKRHGIESDRLDMLKYVTDEGLENLWRYDEDFQGLNYHDKVKKISEAAVFPTGISRKQAECLVKASEITGQNLSFEQALRGEFDWTDIENYKDVLRQLGNSEKEINKTISQIYFGSEI